MIDRTHESRKAVCRTCRREWIISRQHEGPLDDYECPVCEKRRLREQKILREQKNSDRQKKRPFGTGNSRKAK